MISCCTEALDDKLQRQSITRGHEMVMGLLVKAETAHYRTDIFGSLL